MRRPPVLRHFSMTALLLLLLCFLWPAWDSQAEIYRWRDADGKWHFSDSPRDMPEHLRNNPGSRMDTSGHRNIVPSDNRKNSSAVNTGKPKPATADKVSIPFVAREGLADRVIVNITFNGQITAPILVDTGSPGLVISTSLASRLGLFDPDGDNMLVLISGIGGRETAAKTIVDRITIGDQLSEQFIPAHIIRETSSAYQGLVGMDILSQYALTIDSENRRLIATKRSSLKDRPAGRNSNWWRRNFRELNFYRNFWKEQAAMIDRHDSPYSRLTSSYARVKDFILTQQSESGKLYDKLERYARSHSVPKHWRR